MALQKSVDLFLLKNFCLKNREKCFSMANDTKFSLPFVLCLQIVIDKSADSKPTLKNRSFHKTYRSACFFPHVANNSINYNVLFKICNVVEQTDEAHSVGLIRANRSATNVFS